MEKIVDSRVCSIEEIFSETYTVDFYQRDYVWEKKQIEDLVNDLSNEFLRNYKEGDVPVNVKTYDPYYMGEIVISKKDGMENSIIDGQQRLTSMTLLFISLLNEYKNVPGFPKKNIEDLIYKDDFGTMQFRMKIEDRLQCMESLYTKGDYKLPVDASVSVENILNRYNDIVEAFDGKGINESNVACFGYWLISKVKFSKVWTNSDEFAYVIFETMNDRGLSLTQVEMLRSYLLANVNPHVRNSTLVKFDNVIELLDSIKLPFKSKARFEFFKNYFRSRLAQGVSISKIADTDFMRIGKEFHRWVRDNSKVLGLNTSSDFVGFIDKIAYYAHVYKYINNKLEVRNAEKDLYLIVNSDYGFTLQTELILASINYLDNEETVDKKIEIVSKYIAKFLSWRVWNHWSISQSTLDGPVFELCKLIREKRTEEIEEILSSDPIAPKPEDLTSSPTLNRQNRPKIKVLLALITEIVARESGEPSYMLNKKDIEVEHIWSNHYEQHTDEFSNENEFSTVRDNIGDLLVLPKSFNASYGDDSYEKKLEHYFSQNILAQTLNRNKYVNNPGFMKFIQTSYLEFKFYDSFKRISIEERAELYRNILKWNFK